MKTEKSGDDMMSVISRRSVARELARLATATANFFPPAPAATRVGTSTAAGEKLPTGEAVGNVFWDWLESLWYRCCSWAFWWIVVPVGTLWIAHRLVMFVFWDAARTSRERGGVQPVVRLVGERERAVRRDVERTVRGLRDGFERGFNSISRSFWRACFYVQDNFGKIALIITVACTAIMLYNNSGSHEKYYQPDPNVSWAKPTMDPATGRGEKTADGVIIWWQGTNGLWTLEDELDGKTATLPRISETEMIITSSSGKAPSVETTTIFGTVTVTSSVAEHENVPITISKTTTITSTGPTVHVDREGTLTSVEQTILEPITILEPTTIFETMTVTSLAVEHGLPVEYAHLQEDLNGAVRAKRDIGMASEFCRRCGQMHCCEIHD